jgi:DNA recombination-dependent growth factor C
MEASRMGLLSATVSMTRYRIDGDIEKPVMESVARALRKNSIEDIDNDPAEKAVGWTSFDTPYRPDFEGSSFSIGPYFIFCIRIDKKTIPAKLVTKHVTLATARRLAETGRPYLSRDEKKEIKEHVVNVLSLRIPAVPNIYDILWSLESRQVCFFSNLKSANEEFETLFQKSFKLTPIRLFPFTMAERMAGLDPGEKDVLASLSATRFSP